MPTDALAHTRDGMHHAVQVPSALAATLATGDDVHEVANLGWDPRFDALVGRRVGPGDSVAAGLRLRDATWIVVRDDEIVDERAVVGSTLDRARSWLQGVVAGLGGEDRELSPVGYPLPSHPAGEGKPFADLDEAELDRLHRWYSLANTVLTGLRAQESRARPVRCWPHHFDLATLIVLEPDVDPEHARSIGIGMTPGDDLLPEPYLYVNPYPRPDGAELPALGRGRWHTDGFLGAILMPGEPVESDMSAFVGEAVARCHTLLAAE